MLYSQTLLFIHPIYKSLPLKVKVLVSKSRLALCNPMDCNPPVSSIHGILQARILEWIAIPFSRGPSRHRDRTWVLPHYRQLLYHLSREVTQLCPTLCDPMDCSLPGSSVHGIFQAMVLEWIAISFSRWSSWPRDWTQVSRIVDRSFTTWATREPHLEAQFASANPKFPFLPSPTHPPPWQLLISSLYLWVCFCFIDMLISIVFLIPHISDTIWLLVFSDLLA